MDNKLNTHIYAAIFLWSLNSIIAFFSPIALMFYLIFLLCTMDLVTRLMKILKENKGKTIKEKLQRIKSHFMKFTFLKAFFYIMFIGLVYMMEIAIFGKSFYITNILLLMFSMTEIYSIAENLDFFFGKNIFVRAVKKIRDIFVNKINKLVKASSEKKK